MLTKSHIVLHALGLGYILFHWTLSLYETQLVQDSVSWAWIPLRCKYSWLRFVPLLLKHFHCLLRSARKHFMSLNPMRLKFFASDDEFQVYWWKHFHSLLSIRNCFMGLNPIRFKFYFWSANSMSTVERTFTVCYLAQDTVSWVWIPQDLSSFAPDQQVPCLLMKALSLSVG